MNSEPPPEAQITAQHWRQLFQQVETCLMFVLDHAGRVCFLNDAARSLLGNASDASAWLDASHFHDPVSKTFLAQSLRYQLATSRPAPVSLAWLSPNGNEYVFECHISGDADGYSLLTIRDQTRDWISLHLAPSEREIGPDVGKIAHVAHDLGNVFGILQLAAGSLAGLELPDRSSDKIRDILDAVERGSALTQSLQTNDQTEPRPEMATDVAATLLSTVKILKRVAPPDVALDVKVPGDPCLAQCEKSPLEAAIIQMFSRSRLAVANQTGSQKQISIVLEQSAGAITIAFRNSHDVNSEQDLHALKDPYIDQERALHGSGPGLSDVDKFARDFGGDLSIWPSGRDGQAIVLRLPCALKNEMSEPDTDPELPSLEGYRLLLVEPDPTLQTLLCEALRQSGAEVAAAASGKDALHTLQHRRDPDVLIVPGAFSDGTSLDDLTNELNGKHPNTRVVCLSASPKRALDLNAAFPALWLGKPVDFAALVNTIRLQPSLQSQAAQFPD